MAIVGPPTRSASEANPRLLKIGAFARDAGATPKALRHWDGLGLLRPAWVDPASGYRYYEANQVTRVGRIRELTALGLSLRSVREALGADDALEDLERVLAARRDELRGQIREASLHLMRIEAHLATLAVDHMGESPLQSINRPSIRGSGGEITANLHMEEAPMTANDRIESTPPRMSRRQLAAAAAGAAMAFDGARPASARLAPRTPPAGTGVLRVSDATNIDGRTGLDPNGEPANAMVVRHLYNRLCRLGEDLRPAPELAVAWEPNADASTWTFTLREGVRFHDGKPMVAGDVVYSYRRILEDPEGLIGAYALTGFIEPEGVKAPDDRTVVFSLTTPHAEFPSVTLDPYQVVIPDGSGPSIRETGVGTGPFRVVEQGEVNVLEAFSGYWDGPPAVARLEAYVIGAAEARAAALLAGQLDFAGDLDPATLALVGTDPDLVAMSVPSNSYVFLVMRCDEPPFDDPRVRLAMKLVADRGAILSAIVGGEGVQGIDHPIGPREPYRLEGDRPQAIGRARELLAEAGHSAGIDIRLYTGDARPAYLPLAIAYREQAAAAGIRVDIRQLPGEDFFEAAANDPGSLFTNDTRGRTTDVALSYFLSDSQVNPSRWISADFDRLVGLARQELDFGRRRAIYQEAQALVMDGSGIVIPAFQNMLMAHHRRVEGFPTPLEYGVRDFHLARVAPDA